ncbi:MAG: ADP-ribosylglycohydrolase family protein [Armatimonadetes bacterium]|nr:ADP-ribosylglycohydrolase family protein [Armatimonadota bacterium]
MTDLWLCLSREDVLTERLQAEQEGRSLEAVLTDFDRFENADLSDPAAQEATGALLDRVQALPYRDDFPYDEPSGLQAVREARPPGRFRKRPAPGDLLDRLWGAWTGRCCGCLLGKPVEGWRRQRLWGYLKESGQWPLSSYISADAPERVRSEYGVSADAPFSGRVSAMPEDDDLNYTVAGLHVLERYGRGFDSADVAAVWMSCLPVLRTCTAERVAYRNLVHGLEPPKTAAYRNPYREWVGAQIRADAWGYVNPGDPETAAEYAYRDAAVSHVKNGVYGEMWAAAMIASAFVEGDVRAVVEAGLREVPRECRLAEAVRRQISNRQGLDSPVDAIEAIHAVWNEERAHDWCHAVSNAEVVAMALLWGDGDFGRSVCLAVQACFDTDCNGATVGSVLGAMHGRSRLSGNWACPLNDTLETGVHGFHLVALKEMAERSLKIACDD